MRVIEPALRELKEKSGLKIEWKPIKFGKTIKQLEFVFSETTEMENEISEDQMVLEI